MGRHQFSFTLLDGSISIDNESLKIHKKGGFTKQLREKGWLLLIAILITYKGQKNIFANELNSTKNYLSFTLSIVMILIIIALTLFYVFKYNWNDTISINKIETIEKEENDSEVELNIITSNKREKSIKFRTLENQVSPFIEALLKRNSRIIIKNL